MTPEERARIKALWKHRGDAIAAEREADKNSLFGINGLFGVNGPVSRGVGTVLEATHIPALVRGANRSSLGIADLVAWDKAPELSQFKDTNWSDPTLRRTALSVLPEGVKPYVKSYQDVTDRLATVGAKWAPDVFFLRGLGKAVPAVVKATSKAPLSTARTAVTSVKGHPFKTAFNGSILWGMLKDMKNDINFLATGEDAYREKLQKNIEENDQYQQVLAQNQLEVPIRATEFMSSDNSLGMEKAIGEAIMENLQNPSKDSDKTSVSGKLVKPEEIPSSPKAPIRSTDKKPFDWRDYKGELGFGALGGAAGYGLGHILKWGMSAKLLSALTGAALSAYGYNRLKG